MSMTVARLQGLLPAACLALMFPVALGVMTRTMGGATERAPVSVVVVVTLLLWVVVLLSARASLLRAISSSLAELEGPAAHRSMRLLGSASGDVTQERDLRLPDALARYLGAVPGRPVSRSTLRELLRDLSDRASAWYLPIHGLVWALPGVGFLGTAWELRSAMLLALAQSGAVLGQAKLASQLRPLLSSAFEVMCVALAGAALAHVASTILAKQETLLWIEVRTALRGIAYGKRSLEEDMAA